MKELSVATHELRKNPNGIRFSYLVKICSHFFGEPRQQRTSHLVYQMPWPSDPRVNIQDKKGMAKGYQVKQVIKALEKLERLQNDEIPLHISSNLVD